MGYVGWGLVAEQANTTTGGAQRTVGITSSPGAGIAQSSLNSVNNGGGGVVNNYGAVWDNLFVRQYLFGRGEQGAWFDPSDFQPNWRRNLLTWTEDFSNAAWVNTIAGTGVAATVTANQGIAPDGTNTADRIQFNLGGGTTTSDITRRRQSYVTPATTHTFSLYLRSFDGVSTYNMHLVSSDGSTVNIVVTGTWQRFVVTAVGTGSPVSYAVGLRGGQTPANSNTADVLVWGAQLEVGSTATAYQPITDGIVDYFTYQPQPILYQDSAGVTPVTALEQPCGLMLDKSKGLQLGPELFSSFSTVTSPWTNVSPGVWSIDGSQIANRDLSISSFYTINNFYVTTFTLSNVSGGTVSVFAGEGAGTSLGNGTHTFRRTASQNYLIFRAPAGVAATVSAGTVRELPGNHAYQTTSAKRPVVSARVNLLTYTEQFDNAAWTKGNSTITANATTAPDGTSTADKLVENTGVGVEHYVLAVNTTIGAANTICTSIVYVKAAERTRAQVRAFSNGAPVAQASFNLSTLQFSGISGGTWAYQDAGGGWYRISVTATHTSSSGNGVGVFLLDASGNLSYTGDGTSGMFIWGADLRPADQATGIMPRYQRVGAATYGSSTAAGVADYDSVGFPVYLRTDGSDDAMLTNSIDFSAGPTNPPIIGPELTNSSAVGSANWTTLGNRTWSSNGGSGYLSFASLTAGKTYQFIWTISNYVAGTPALYVTVPWDDTRNGNGTYTKIITATSSNCQFYSASFNGTLTVSVREIDAAYAPDKMTVWAGVRKLSDAAAFGCIAETSTDAGANNGAFALYKNNNATSYYYILRGSVFLDAVSTASFTSPITNVLQMTGDISGSTSSTELTSRINGASNALTYTNGPTAGTGNFGNYPLYLFARNQTSLYFTGNFYGLIVRGAQTDTSLITTTEEYIANVTGFGAPVVVGTPSIGVSI